MNKQVRIHREGQCSPTNANSQCPCNDHYLKVEEKLKTRSCHKRACQICGERPKLSLSPSAIHVLPGVCSWRHVYLRKRAEVEALLDTVLVGDWPASEIDYPCRQEKNEDA
jgi:hypothetical protein